MSPCGQAHQAHQAHQVHQAHQHGRVGDVVIIGTGLMGTSLGLALHRAGGIGSADSLVRTRVRLADRNHDHLRTAVALGAGMPYEPDREDDVDEQPDLVVVGVPPLALGSVVADALRRFPNAVVTDLGSVKAPVTAEVRTLAPGLAGRYVGGHPMAGSEQSGPLAARADLFDGRAWAITPHSDSTPEAIATVETLSTACGAFPVRLQPDEHDEAVALVSHLPQVASSVVAGLLARATDQHLVLAGQGLRDVTRIAAGDPDLWTQILSANARPVAELLRTASEELAGLAEELDAATPELPARPPSRRPLSAGPGAGAGDQALAGVLERGVAGVRRLPGKHGARPEEFATVAVQLPDRPGELARLFADVGAAGVNIEDVRIDHSPGTPAGLVELFVAVEREQALLGALEQHGWALHG